MHILKNFVYNICCTYREFVNVGFFHDRNVNAQGIVMNSQHSHKVYHAPVSLSVVCDPQTRDLRSSECFAE